MKMPTVLLCALLCGCMITQIPEDQAGPRPTNAEATIRQYLADTLKDPASVTQFEVTRAPSPCKLGSRSTAGWCVTYQYNAKNSYGGYVGRTLHNMVIQNDRVLLVDIWPIE